MHQFVDSCFPLNWLQELILLKRLLHFVELLPHFGDSMKIADNRVCGCSFWCSFHFPQIEEQLLQNFIYRRCTHGDSVEGVDLVGVCNVVRRREDAVSLSDVSGLAIVDGRRM